MLGIKAAREEQVSLSTTLLREFRSKANLSTSDGAAKSLVPLAALWIEQNLAFEAWVVQQKQAAILQDRFSTVKAVEQLPERVSSAGQSDGCRGDRRVRPPATELPVAGWLECSHILQGCAAIGRTVDAYRGADENAVLVGRIDMQPLGLESTSVWFIDPTGFRQCPTRATIAAAIEFRGSPIADVDPVPVVLRHANVGKPALHGDRRVIGSVGQEPSAATVRRLIHTLVISNCPEDVGIGGVGRECVYLGVGGQAIVHWSPSASVVRAL